MLKLLNCTLKWCLLGGLLSHAHLSDGQDGVLDEISARLDSVMRSENCPGISVGIWYRDSAYFLNKGYHSRGSETEVTENSIFQIGSLGKMYIGIIAHHLLLDGKIQADDQIIDYLPASLDKKTTIKLGHIKVHDLLFHRSGLPRDTKVGSKRQDGDPYLFNYTETELIKELERLKVKNAGEFSYSNFGYALLSYVLEQASGSSYEDLLMKYIVTPYALQRTRTELDSTLARQLVTAYRKDDRSKVTPPWSMGLLGPPSSVYSTSSDLIKLLRHQISAYQNNLVSEVVAPLMLTSKTKEAFHGTGIEYGYGMFSWGNGTFGHGGDLDGYGSDYSIDPGKSTGVVILTSSGGRWVSALMIDISKILNR